MPGVGFASGMERLAMLLPDVPELRPDFYLAVADEAALPEAFNIAQSLRLANFNGEMSFAARSLKNQLKTAARLNVRHCLVFGGTELQNKTIQVKNMDNGEQNEIPLSELEHFLSAWAAPKVA